MQSEQTSFDCGARDFERKLSALSDFLRAQKALDPYIHIFTGPNSIADAFVIVTATSRRHAQGLAENLLCACKDQGWEYLRMEGFDLGQWILVDCNDIIIHIFQEEARNLYRLEDLCSNAPSKEKQT